MNIRNCIAELLLLHDCVIIPGLGGFIGNYSPASIDQVHHAFLPPSKKLLFNINLKQNDGLLANAVADALAITYAHACKLIDDFTDDCRFVLKNGKPFVLPGVGKLMEGNEGVIYFEQEQGANLLPDSFGLTPFISPPVLRQPSFLSPEWNLSQQHIIPPGRNFFIPRSLKWAAAVILPIGIAAVIGVTQYDKLSANFANNAGILNSVISRFSAASLVEKKEAPPSPVTRTTKVLPPAPVPVGASSGQAGSPSADAVSPAIRHDDRFAVIIGAFRLKENAEKLVSDLQKQGIEASVFDQSKSGLYRITIGTSSSRTEAIKILASAQSFSGAWVLSK